MKENNEGLNKKKINQEKDKKIAIIRMRTKLYIKIK
jgi:hypothetical protein